MSLTRDITGSKVVIIGGAGFVGSHLADLLVNESVGEVVVFDNFLRGRKSYLTGAMSSPKLRIVEGDIRDTDALARVMDGADYVFHLAALWLVQCVEDPRAAIEANITGTFNVIEACQRAKVKRVVYSSSASVYGDMLVSPMDEAHPFNNRTMYGATKIAGEQMFRAFNEMHKLDWVGLRYFNIYGPRQDHYGAYVGVMLKVLDRVDAGQAPVIFGDGSQSYDFVYVGDVARANLAALRSTVTDECFNVASGRATSINEVIRMLIELSGSSIEPEYRPAAQSFVSNRLASIDRTAEALGFRSEVDIREGISRLIAWRREEIYRTQRLAV
jgi:UDP-glucose 4-epimerase